MSSNKRQRVPAGLHAELSDYAHALRALRTNNALDVTSQLIHSTDTRPDGAAFESDPELSDEPSRVPTTDEPVASGSTPDLSQARKRPRRERSTSKKSVDAGNTWSRWPLPPEELRESEWDFSEEVQAIARQSASAHTKLMREAYEAEAQDDATLSEEEDFDALDHTAIVNMASDQLERMLASLVSFAPAAAEQWANRFSGVSWEAVLHIVSASEIMDASIVERAQTRLEALYGPAELPAAARATLREADARAVDEFEYGFDYLALPYPKPRHASAHANKDEEDTKNRKKRRRERNSVTSEDGSDSDSDVPLARRMRTRKSTRQSAPSTTPQSQPADLMEVDETAAPTTPGGRRRSARLATPVA